MPRLPRLLIPGTAAHIVQRGNNRMACFRSDEDYLVFLALLRRLSAAHDCALHAYCLMPNHFHLLLTPENTAGCAAVMRDTSQRYAHYFNKRYARTGTLWEGRFRSCVTESASYVLACYRYIELNPVRAGLVSHPSAYLWSSYAANSGARTDPMITSHVEYDALGAGAAARAAAYARMVGSPVDEALIRTIREATHGGYPLASDAFKLGLQPADRRLERGKPGPRRLRNSVPGTEFGSRN